MKKLALILIIILTTDFAFALTVKERLQRAKENISCRSHNDCEEGMLCYSYENQGGKCTDRSTVEELREHRRIELKKRELEQLRALGVCTDDNDCQAGWKCYIPINVSTGSKATHSGRCMDSSSYKSKLESDRIKNERKRQLKKKESQEAWGQLKREGYCRNDEDCPRQLRCSLLTSKCVGNEVWEKDKIKAQREYFRRSVEYYNKLQLPKDRIDMDQFNFKDE